jgi:hypothetical protein
VSTYKQVVPATGEQGEPLLEQAPDARTVKLLRRFQKGLPLNIKQFTYEEKIGFKPRLNCWCGGSIELDYFDREYDDAMGKLIDWLDTHADCEPKE